jgi:ribosomal protein L11 methyltransferase
MKIRKPLWRISIATTLEAEDAVAELLGGTFNSSASSYFDFEKKTSRVTVFVPHKIDADIVQKLRHDLINIKECGLGIGTAKISVAKVRREDWAESWKRHFKPIEIGKTLLLKPSWSKKRPGPNQAVVVLDPGLSFGTGQHATTEFCLQQIVQHANPAGHLSLLDIGTGSGILAIAAAKLGYKPIHAFDFDPEAVRVACANARTNGVLPAIKISCSNVSKLPMRTKRRYNFICANLISDLLIRERERIVAQLEPGGILVLAGILRSEFEEVERAFGKLGLKLVCAKSKKEWRSGTFCLA